MELKKTRVTVKEVINADTFKVAPHWQSTGQEEGDTIKINGYTAPDLNRGKPDLKKPKLIWKVSSEAKTSNLEIRKPLPAGN